MKKHFLKSFALIAMLFSAITMSAKQYCQEDTALEQPAVQTKPRKVIEDGQIYIIHNGIRYNALGTQIK